MTSYRRRAALVLMALVTGCLIAACGSSSSTNSSTTTSTAASASSTGTGGAGSGAGASRFTALRACLKQHGVTLPTRRPGSGPGGPGGGGGFFGGGGGAGAGGSGGGGGFAARNPKLAAAMKACGAGNFRGGGRRFRLSATAINNYVACVRQHGFPSMPSPNLSGKGAVFPSSIRTNPKFESASKSCQSLLIPPRTGTGTPTTSSS